MRKVCVIKTMVPFDELPKDKQAKEIEKHRDINVEFDWWDCNVDDVTQTLVEMGLSVEKNGIQFDLEYTATCSGRLDIDDYLKWKGRTDCADLVQYVDTIEVNDNEVTIYDTGIEDPEEDDLADGLTQVAEGMSKKELYLQRMGDLSNDIQTDIGEKMTAFLKTLKEDYNYLTSDEGIAEFLRENEMEFEIDRTTHDITMLPEAAAFKPHGGVNHGTK